MGASVEHRLGLPQNPDPPPWGLNVYLPLITRAKGSLPMVQRPCKDREAAHRPGVGCGQGQEEDEASAFRAGMETDTNISSGTGETTRAAREDPGAL